MEARLLNTGLADLQTFKVVLDGSPDIKAMTLGTGRLLCLMLLTSIS